MTLSIGIIGAYAIRSGWKKFQSWKRGRRKKANNIIPFSEYAKIECIDVSYEEILLDKEYLEHD